MPEASEKTISVGDQAPAFDLQDTEGERPPLGERQRAPRLWSCSPATTAPTRSPGTTGSPRSRATTRTAACACLRSTPTTPSGIPADSFEAMKERARGRWLAHAVPARRDAGGRPAYGAQTTPDVFLIDAGGSAALPRRARTRLRRSVAERRMAARRARRGAGRPRSRPAETKPVGCTIKWKPVAPTREPRDGAAWVMTIFPVVRESSALAAP